MQLLHRSNPVTIYRGANDNIRTMQINNISDRIMIDNDDGMATFLSRIGAGTRIGLDTEFMRERTYFARLCLLQVALDGQQMACIDPLTIDSIGLGRMLGNLDAEFIAHSAGQDIDVLSGATGFIPDTLFDTQIAAAFAGIGDQISYAALVNELLGVQLEKGETRTDWARRPLTTAQLDYAFDDVAHLHAVAEILTERLHRTDKLKWCLRACQEQVSNYRHAAVDQWINRFKQGPSVPIEDQSLLRELLLWRESEARSSDRPREWIIASNNLIAIAHMRPESMAHLREVGHLNDAQMRKYAHNLLKLVQNADKTLEDKVIWPPRTELDANQKGALKELQKRLRQYCEDLEIFPTVIASRADLEARLLGRPNRLDSGWRQEFVDNALG